MLEVTSTSSIVAANISHPMAEAQTPSSKVRVRVLKSPMGGESLPGAGKTLVSVCEREGEGRARAAARLFAAHTQIFGFSWSR